MPLKPRSPPGLQGYAFNERYLDVLRFSHDLEQKKCEEMHYACINVVEGYADIQRRAMLSDASTVVNSTKPMWYQEEAAKMFVTKEKLERCIEKANNLFSQNGLPAIKVQIRI